MPAEGLARLPRTELPTDDEVAWSRGQVVPADEVLARIDAASRPPPTGSPEARCPPSAAYADGGGVIGAMTQLMCGSCDRILLTAEGQSRNCPFAVRETDLRALLLGRVTDDDLAASVEAEVGRRWAGHAIGQVHVLRTERSMSQIGG